MQEEASITYHCINSACGHGMPRVVNFCPYCGTPQQAGRVRPAPVQVAVPVAAPVPAESPVTAAPPVWTPPPPPPSPAQPARQAFVPPTPPVRAAPTPAAPPQRPPLHWGWWLIGAGLLWLAWIVARPATHKIDSRIDAAIDMAQACKGKQAQSELIALRATRATPKQLQRLQTALNDAASTCERKRVREKAWADASSAIDAALASSAAERARSRLAAFTRRWGEDADTAAAKTRIEAARRTQASPAPEPAPSPSLSRQASQESASNLIEEAERDISRGNYKGAIDKMDACVSMVDAGNRACMALKAKAQRLYQGL